MRQIAAVCFLLSCGCPPTAIQNHALLLNTGDRIATHFDLAQVAGKAHSVSFRAMLQYPNSYFGDMIGESGTGSYVLLKQNSGSSQCNDPPQLASFIGGTFATYPNPSDTTNGFAANKWYTIIFTVNSDHQLHAYVDGQPAGSSVSLSSGAWATGVLQFGQRNPANTNPPDEYEQFWGMIDDVVIWDHELSSTEIANIVKQPVVSAKAAGVLGSYTFDVQTPGALVPVDPDLIGGNQPIISGNDDDSQLFTQNLPNQKTAFSLPVKGQWKVMQGSDSPPCGSHRGYASFSIDLMYHGDPAQTQGKPIYAAADGTVTMIRDTSPDDQPNEKVPGCTECKAGDGSCDYAANEITIKHADGEYSSYLHLGQGTVPQAIKDAFKNNALVHKGDVIGLAGRSGTHDYHVHFAMLWTETLPAVPVTTPGTDTPNSPCGYTPAVPDDRPLVTRPFAFTDFWLQANSAGSYQHVNVAQLHVNDSFCDQQSCS